MATTYAIDVCITKDCCANYCHTGTIFIYLKKIRRRKWCIIM